ncbi:MAG: ArsR/SmtB family transcription factor [Acidimicrobiales bacterium]
MAKEAVSDPLLVLARELADPIRLAVVERLAAEGSSTVNELAAEIGVAMPQLSNHLARLRAAGLVTVQRSGRHGIYSLVNPDLGAELGALRATLPAPEGRGAKRKTPPAPPPMVLARSCYDHVAGLLGVSLFQALTEKDAIAEVGDAKDAVVLGPAGERVFSKLGVDVDQATKAKRRYAFACLDWTERKPHLGGALGGAMAQRFTEAGWITKEESGRLLSVTPAGRAALKRQLGISLPPAGKVRQSA